MSRTCTYTRLTIIPSPQDKAITVKPSNRRADEDEEKDDSDDDKKPKEVSVQPHCFRHGVCAAVLTFTCGSWTQMIQSSSVCTGRGECKSCLPARGTPARRPRDTHIRTHLTIFVFLVLTGKRLVSSRASPPVSSQMRSIVRWSQALSWSSTSTRRYSPFPVFSLTLGSRPRDSHVVPRSIWQCRCA